jgi:hypothetical protein
MQRRTSEIYTPYSNLLDSASVFSEILGRVGFGNNVAKLLPVADSIANTGQSGPENIEGEYLCLTKEHLLHAHLFLGWF